MYHLTYYCRSSFLGNFFLYISNPADNRTAITINTTVSTSGAPSPVSGDLFSLVISVVLSSVVFVVSVVSVVSVVVFSFSFTNMTGFSLLYIFSPVSISVASPLCSILPELSVPLCNIFRLESA